MFTPWLVELAQIRPFGMGDSEFAVAPRMRANRGFEVSVDTRTKGRRLDGYTVRRIDGHEVLLDPDLLKLPIELTITSGGIFGRGLSATADGLNGAACPIELL